MHCKILGLPVQEGTGRVGCNMGPDSYRAAGIAAAIRNSGTTSPISAIWRLPSRVRLAIRTGRSRRFPCCRMDRGDQRSSLSRER